MFRTDAGTVLNWFKVKGYGSDDIRHCSVRMVKSKLGGSPVGTSSDMMHNYLGRLGYTGTLQDRLNRFFQVKTGVVNPAEAERAFFKNTALDFT